MKQRLTKLQEAALRYAESERGLDVMNMQLAAFIAGAEWQKNLARGDASSGNWITLEEVSARRGLNGDFEETLNEMLTERYGPLITNKP